MTEIRLTSTALELPDDMPFEDWVAYGRDRLMPMSRSIMWWLGDWWAYGQHKYGERAKTAVESLPWAFQTCMDAGWVARKIETSRRREVVPWSYHKEIAKLEAADQDCFLDDWAIDLPKQAAARAEVNAFKRQLNRPQFDVPVTDLIDAGPFNVLYADPPWRYDFSPTDSRAIENQYPTMDLAEICALQPPVLDDAVLFLWATSPKLVEAMQVIPAWGFEYRTTMVWVKDRIGMGYYVREQHELVLIARRGNMPMPEPDSRPSSVVYADRGRHSEKPEEFYKLIESMFPAMLYGEVFARERRDGWGSWGNQV